MNLLLKTDVFLQNGLTDEEVLYLLALSRDCDMERARQSLEEKGFISQESVFGDYKITEKGLEAIKGTVLDSDKNIPSKNDKELRELACDLIAMFPKGYQQGNRYPWRGSPAVISDRLRTFMLKFNNEYTYDEIREATKRYVEHYKDTGQMRTMIYFIWNNKAGSLESPLANEIEILRSGESQSNGDWQNTMV